MTVVGVLGTFETAAENSELAARHVEAAGGKAIRIHRDEPLVSKARKLAACDVVYGAGFGFAAKLWALARAMGKRTVNHWVGTDVMLAREDARHRGMAGRARPFIQQHLTVAPWLAEELAEIEIAATIIPIVTPIRFSPRATPAAPGILAYLPDDRAEFYGAEVVRHVAAALPDAPVAVVAGTAARQPALPNVTYLGWTDDMPALYERYPILLRVAKHDGLPKMVLEALAYGNQVVFEHAFPGCRRARDEGEALAQVKAILAEGCPINTTGAQAVAENYRHEIIVGQLLAALGVKPQ